MEQQPSLSVLSHSLYPLVHSKFMGIKLLQQVHEHTEFCSWCPAWCYQTLFQLLTGCRATLGSQTGKFCQEICTSHRIQTCSITLQHWKWFGRDLLWFTLWDFQAQKFCLELSFGSFIASNGPLLRSCGWGLTSREGLLLRGDPALVTGGQFQNIFLLPWSISWSPQSQNCGSDKTVMGSAKNYSVGFVSLSSRMCQQTSGQVLTRWLWQRSDQLHLWLSKKQKVWNPAATKAFSPVRVPEGHKC